MQDATITLLNLLHKHLEGSGNHARLLFVDFSSPFNTIQPHLLVEKLLNNFSLDPSLTGWLLDFLTQRVQRVLSSGLISSTGSPQGCVISPLYILYTNDCCSQHDNRHILKFADDSVIVSLLNSHKNEHGPVINDFVSWCEDAFLHLNISKTKNMSIDFRRLPPAPKHSVINSQDIEIVSSYKYLGTLIDEQLKFDLNTSSVCKRGQQRNWLSFRWTKL